MRDKKALIIGGVVVFLAFAYWLLKDATKPLPGESVADLGQEHVTDIAEVQYNSNPPTSGPHFPVWAKPGVYDRVISDGHLIHSLEHGYINISYNCAYKPQSQLPIFNFQFSKVAKAHEEEIIATESGEATKSAIPLVHMQVPSGGVSWWSPENPPQPEINLPDVFRSEECKRFAESLYQLTEEAERIILVPRPQLDSTVALTAWTRILKLNPSIEFGPSNEDLEKAKEFIKAYHNKGPEKTME